MEGEEKYLLEIFCFFNFVTLKFLQHVGYEAGEGEVDMVFNEMREEWKKWVFACECVSVCSKKAIFIVYDGETIGVIKFRINKIC